MARVERRGSAASRSARAGQWGLAAALAGAALVVGTVHTITLCLVTAVLAASVLTTWWDAEPFRVRSSATLLLCVGAALTVYTALQTVPIPLAWLSIIAPHNAEVWTRCLSPLHEPGPRWAPISLDPTATRVELLKGIAYLLAFVTALRIARRRDGAAFLTEVIVATAAIVALAALLHPAFGARKLFGLYEPSDSIPDRHVAPLMNPNHLAAYLNVGFCLALAGAMSPEPRVPRVISFAVALLLAGSQVWVASRGGVVCMILGGLLVGGMVWASRPKRRAPVLGLTLLASLAAISGVGMMALSSPDAKGELFSTDVSKLELFRQAMRMLAAYPVFGAGRGSFASTFPEFRSPFEHVEGVGLHVTFSVPENVIAQWTTEWGLPVAVLAAAGIVWALRPRAALARSTTAAGAWAALIAVATQNLVDYSSEVPGVMLTLVATAAIVVGGSVGRVPRWRVESWSTAPRAVSVLAPCVAFLGLVACACGVGQELAQDEEALHDAALVRPRPLPELIAFARSAMHRHPAEPYFPFIIGLRIAEEHAPGSLAWLGATLERAPLYGPAHFVIARVVGRSSPSQARMEYRLALEDAPELAPDIMREAPFRVFGYSDALEVVPRGYSRPAIMELLSTALSERLPATRVRLDEQLASMASASGSAVARLATDAVEDLEAGESAPWCTGAERSHCARAATDRLKQLQALLPDKCAAFELHARLLVETGQAKQALDELDQATGTVGDRLPCLRALVGLASGVKDEARVQSTLDKIVRAGCSSPEECAENLAFVASQEEAHGRPRSALSFYERAFEQTPENDGILAQMARLSAAAGLHAEAAQYYEKLARRQPQEASWGQAAAREGSAALEERPHWP